MTWGLILEQREGVGLCVFGVVPAILSRDVGCIGLLGKIAGDERGWTASRTGCMGLVDTIELSGVLGGRVGRERGRADGTWGFDEG